MLSSTSKIRAGIREFNTTQELLDSVLYQIIWWKDLIVKFPDKDGSTSQAFVEVYGKEITVGYGDFYYTYHKNTYKEALEFAEKINRQWLDTLLPAREFVETLVNG
jgi:hypothetical protein